ncbi:hypothetical protein QN277_010966 [Acacia crassicarpa]|uniref:Uncharacterized protein n=1 Tax=Acacia crassicarpa TaxID=499986 RepID=A0AAE1M5S5_9FABA|nr:hypothetical protein QN277_010966 [Acacia crassicarpa]
MKRDPLQLRDIKRWRKISVDGKLKQTSFLIHSFPTQPSKNADFIKKTSRYHPTTLHNFTAEKKFVYETTGKKSLRREAEQWLQVPEKTKASKAYSRREQKNKRLSRRQSVAAAGTSWKSGVRRSTRIKTRPLEYWKGEDLFMVAYTRVSVTISLTIWTCVGI